MSTLDEDDKKALELLREAAKKRDAIPPSERRRIARPERFADPVGFDDEGNPFPDIRQPASKDKKR